MPYSASYGRRVYSSRQRLSAARVLQTVVRRKQNNNKYKNLKLAKPVATLVQRKIDKNNPNRYTAFHQRRIQFTNLINDSPATRIWDVIPTIAQGVERHDREGTKIKLQHIHIKGRIDIPADDNPLVGNDDRAQIYVRLMCLSIKQEKFIGQVRSDWTAEFDDKFFKDESTPFAPTGQYIDMLSSINREVYTVHYDRVMKLDRNYPFFPDPTSTSGATVQRPVSREFKISLKVKNKVLNYAEPSNVRSQNFQPFCCALFCYGNAAIPSSSAVPFIEYLSKVSFKE